MAGILADGTKDTGKRVNYATVMMPRNGTGVTMDVTEYNRSDGFSAGSSIITRVPNVDLAVTGAPPVTDIAQSLDAGSPTVDRQRHDARPSPPLRRDRLERGYAKGSRRSSSVPR